MLRLLIILVIFTSNLPVLQSMANKMAKLQGCGVKGRLVCGKVPLVGAKPDIDDLLAENYTDSNGQFQLNGATREMSTIETLLKIYHDCDDGIRPCQRKIMWHIPSSYHHEGILKEYFDIGTVNMEIGFPGEERDCRH
ncbi:unnamed protein product [Anisakis simplex]|uniref:Transthyretin-like protein 46 n=1 Tax=Anisakis simplex TaxID=6269 RepID=A0A0M3K1H1_ANISI|nr:unnamed protein product [Anisakis simplex]